jgi:enoyl-CoA hydratase/carnithine racemase
LSTRLERSPFDSAIDKPHHRTHNACARAIQDRAKRIVLTGEYFTEQEAYAMGWLDCLVPEGEFESKVKEATQSCLKIASEGQKQTKHLLGLAFDLNWKDFLEEYTVCQEKTLGSEEHREAMAAYREKRDPKFS